MLRVWGGCSLPPFLAVIACPLSFPPKILGGFFKNRHTHMGSVFLESKASVWLEGGEEGGGAPQAALSRAPLGASPWRLGAQPCWERPAGKRWEEALIEAI